MQYSKPDISNKVIAFQGASIAVASVFVYSFIVMIYCIIRSSASIFYVMPFGERVGILWASSVAVAYSVAVFSVILAVVSSLLGAAAALILKSLLFYFNPRYILQRSFVISCITAMLSLGFLYLLLHSLLKDWMTFQYLETFAFWFLFPAAVFISACFIGGRKLNNFLQARSVTS